MVSLTLWEANMHFCPDELSLLATLPHYVRLMWLSFRLGVLRWRFC